MERFKQWAEQTWEVVREAALGFTRDHASHLAAALAFYALFAVAPLLLIATAIGGVLWGVDTARAEILDQVRLVVGPEALDFIAGLLENWSDASSGFIASAIGAATTLYLAFRVFDALRELLNTVWGVRVHPNTSWGTTARNYLRSLLTMFLVGPLFVASTLISELLVHLDFVLADVFGLPIEIGTVTYLSIALLLLTVMFSVIYKWLPDVHIQWRDVLFGALVTAVLFSIGRSLIGLYLAYASTASLFGAAGSLVVLLFWTFYSAQILFFGAELTEAYATRFGNGIQPSEASKRIVVPSGEEE